MIYNVNKTNNELDRKTEAISIAINTIEAVKGIGVNVINDENFDENTLVSELPYIMSTDETPTITDTDATTKTITGIIIQKDGLYFYSIFFFGRIVSWRRWEDNENIKKIIWSWV